MYQNSGEHFLYTREFDKAIEQYHEALELDPTFSIAHGGLSQAYALKGMLKESMEHFEEMTALDGNPTLAAKVKAAYAQSGYRRATRVILEERRLKRSSGRWISFADDAYLCVMLNEKDLALTALDKAVEERVSSLLCLLNECR